jgi:integrase/recombinase XerD
VIKLNHIRNGGDVYSLQNLKGHADLQVLRRYLAMMNEDLQIAHIRYSPVENSDL